MTRLIISTCNREVPLDAASGHLYTVDLQSLKILQRTAGIEPPYRQFDLNLRGGMRGLKGMSLHHNELVIANYSVLFFMDCNWNLLQTMTHPSVSGIHEIFAAADGVWVTSSANDLLVQFGRDGSLQVVDYIRSHRNMMQELRGPRRELLKKIDILRNRIDFRHPAQNLTGSFDQTHLNGIDVLPDGSIMLSLGLIADHLFSVLDRVKTQLISLGGWKILLSFNRWLRKTFGLKKHMLSELVVQPPMSRSAIIRGHPQDGWRTHVQYRVTQNPSHSPRFLKDGTVLYLDSSRGRLVHLDQKGYIISDAVITDKFLRGLLVLQDGHVAIGAGNTLMIYDRVQKKMIHELALCEDDNVSIFDIKILPENFELPPNSLQAKFGRIVKFDGTKIIWDC